MESNKHIVFIALLILIFMVSYCLMSLIYKPVNKVDSDLPDWAISLREDLEEGNIVSKSMDFDEQHHLNIAVYEDVPSSLILEEVVKTRGENYKYVFDTSSDIISSYTYLDENGEEVDCFIYDKVIETSTGCILYSMSFPYGNIEEDMAYYKSIIENIS